MDTSHTGVQTPVTKTLRELQQISSTLGSHASLTGSGTIGQSHTHHAYSHANRTASAHNLLSQHGIKADKFYNNPLSFETGVEQRDGMHVDEQQQLVEKKFSGGEAKDLDAYLMHHHELILATTIAACEENRENFLEKMNDTIREDWEKDREDLYRELAGYECLRDTSYDSLQRFQQQPLYPSIEYTDSSSSMVNFGTREMLGTGSMLSDFGKKHAAVVARMNANPDEYSKRGASHLCHEFEEISSDSTNQAVSLRVNQAKSKSRYSESWGLLSDMLDTKNNVGVGHALGSSSPQESLVCQRAVGALMHLCSTFRDNIVQRARQMTMTESSSRMAPSSLASDIASYAQANFSYIGSDLLWVRVYLCLRCGDSSAALQTLKSISVNDSKNVIEPAILDLMSILANNQVKSGTMWKSSLASSPDMAVARRDVSELFHRYKTTPSDRDSERYKIAVLALISGTEQIGRSSRVLSSVDDFMFASLWHSVHSDQSTVELISKMGKMLKKKGPAHFEGDNAQKAWGYAYPLLLSQQFGEALSHLATHGGNAGLLEAAHMAICISSVNAFNECSLLNDKDATSLITMLLVNYSRSFQQADAEAAVEYLVRIPNESGVCIPNSISENAKKEIIRLLLETRAFDVLAGKVSADGTRMQESRGALSRHFNESNLKDLLAETANEALKKRNIRDAAELFALAEKYGSLISLLSRELASNLTEDISSEKRRFWYETSLTFQKANLTSERKSRVIDVLEEEGMLNVGNTFQMLLNLTIFFNMYHERKWNEASVLIDNLQLFPKTENEIMWKVNQFHSLERVVQHVVPQVILAYIECLSEQYSDIKSRFRMTGTVGQALFQRKEELKIRSSYLVTFSGKISSVSSDIRGKIGLIEARMV